MHRNCSSNKGNREIIKEVRAEGNKTKSPSSKPHFHMNYWGGTYPPESWVTDIIRRGFAPHLVCSSLALDLIRVHVCLGSGVRGNSPVGLYIARENLPCKI